MWSAMLLTLPLLILLSLTPTSALKFLCYSPRFASSHANFLGKLSDALVDAGHEVILLSPVLDSKIRRPGTAKARVFEIPQSEFGRAFEKRMSESVIVDFWKGTESWRAIQSWGTTFDLWVAQCNYTINYPGLLDTLRDEKFDAGFGESLDWCMAGLFHLVGIDKFAITESIALKDGFHAITQVPNAPSYVPSILGGSFTDEMTFLQRAENLFNLLFYQHINFQPTAMYQDMFEANYQGFPSVVDMMASNSLFFLNSEPLVDFPRPSAARLIDLGGIAVSNAHGVLEEHWSAVFDLRPKTVLMSFGTLAQAWAMPEHYKETIRTTARAMPDKPEHNVTQGIANLIEAAWLPQREMLNDARLSAFMTHCGQGSTTEANYAGVPLIVVPTFLDQIRTAFQVKRNGVGQTLDKSDLAKPKVFERAVREVLENPKYRNQAKKTAQMLYDKPFTAREIFVRNMEFLAKHGPLRQLDHHGRNLNVFQFYLIDVIGAVVVSACIAVALSLFGVAKIRFITETFAAPEYNCSAHRPEEWTKLYGTPQFLLGTWSIAFSTVCQILYIPSLRVFYRERRITCYKIMFLLALADIGGLACFGTLFGYMMIRGMVFCSNPMLGWIVGAGEVFFWIISSCNCLLLVINRICQLTERSWIFQGTPSSILMTVTVVYGSLESLFTRPPVPNSFHQFCAFNVFIPGHSSDEYSNRLNMIHNICIAFCLIVLYSILCGIVRSKASRLTQTANATSNLQARIFTQATIVCFLFGASSTVWLVQEFLFVPPPSVLIAGMIMVQSVHGLPCIIYLALNRAVRNEFWRIAGKNSIQITQS